MTTFMLKNRIQPEYIFLIKEPVNWHDFNFILASKLNLSGDLTFTAAETNNCADKTLTLCMKTNWNRRLSCPRSFYGNFYLNNVEKLQLQIVSLLHDRVVRV